MTDNRTTELLRKLLEERGVKWWEGEDERKTHWEANGLTWEYFNDENGDAWLGFLGVCESDVTPEQAIAATLGSGTLTDEQVREVIERRVKFFEGGDYDEQVIADDLNSMLGSGTCYIVKTPSDSDFSDDWRYRCSECGCNIPVNERDLETGDVINAANFCPNCGRAVKRG